MRGRKVPPRGPSVLCDGHLSPSTLVVCDHPAALRSIRCWVVPGRDSSSSAGSVRRVPSLHSAVSLRLGYTWPLFLHTSAGVNPAGSVPGVQEAGVPPAGADSVGIPLRYTRHRLRRSDSAWLRLERSTRIRVVSRSGSGRGGRLSPLHVRSLPLRRQARKRSCRCSVPEPSRPHAARPPPRPRSTSFRALGHWETLRRAPRIKGSIRPTAGTRSTVPS